MAEQGDPLLPGPVFATGYHLSGDDLDVTPYGYARYANPTWTALEAALGELEDAEALVFASGSAAIAAVMCATLNAGDAVVVPGDGYPAARTIAAELTRLGVEAREVPTDTEAIVNAAKGAALVLVETPSNPLLDVVDIRAIASVARRLVVDNTLATPLGQRPLDLGADATVLSGSKHLTGHSDLLLGSVATRDPELLGAVTRWRNGTGAILGPFEAWLAHRSLATLDVRLERQCANARALAELLAARADVEEVRYPGLPGDRSHPLAARQMTRFGSVVSFDLGTAQRANAFLQATDRVTEATSFGGVRTTAERRARWGIDAVSPGLVRLSVGIEGLADLSADIARALDAAR
ncbi:MAG TPA: cystathionine gamma-lyase [Conexibacter sp.]|nr:cystathionine gamma-lyase [Conexibacter sp.]